MEFTVGKTRVRIGFAFAATVTVCLMLDTNGTCALRGFRTFEGYECMIYIVVGKLNFSCPPLFA